MGNDALVQYKKLLSELRLEIVYLPIDQLRLNPNNARVHRKSQLRKLTKAIKANGFNNPALIDAAGDVIAGHGRIEAARLAGLSEIPTICLGNLSESQKQALALADNRLHDESFWDDRLLAEQLKNLSTLENFDLETTGFDLGEIDVRIESLSVPTAADRADRLPTLGGTAPISIAGDLWQLGRHRVICGNALDPKAFSQLMEGEKAAAVFSDVPFNVKINGHVSGLGKAQHREFPMAAGEMSSEAFRDFLKEAFTLLARASIVGSLHYIAIDWRHLYDAQVAGEQVYNELKNIAVWVKSNAGMGSFLRSRHECFLIYKYGRAPHRNNIELGRHGRNRSNVWFYPGANNFGRGTEEGNLAALHPTVKPVALVADAIMDCTARGDLVIDSFLGSGTTIIAAEKVGRRCYGIELDPLYVDVIVRRWQAYSGDKARHAETGRTFAEIETERSANHA
jgi:DNA modification methylase